MARFLVKMDAEKGYGLSGAAVPAGSTGFTLSPLMPKSRATAVTLGLAESDDWFLATTDGDVDPGDLWDECHARIAGGNALGLDSGAVTYAEPDILQPFVTADDGGAHGMAVDGSAQPGEERWMKDSSIPHGDTFDWHLGPSFSGLRDAAKSLPEGPWRVRIGHLDTGYTEGHKLLPERLDRSLQRSFVAGDDAASAIDPLVTGILKAPGHGTGTLGLLAGGRLADLLYEDENRPEEYLGGAPHAAVVPVRIAPSVVLLYTSGFAQGLDYLLGLGGNPTTRVDVVSMSMGGVASAAWTDIVNRAYEAGVVLCTAAGNHYGKLPPTSIVYPARYRRVIAVCGVMQDGRPYADLPLSIMCGCYGPQSKMETAIAAYSPNLPWALFDNRTAFRWDGQGTSAATPQVAAAAALYVEKNYDQLPTGWARVEAVRHALFTAARKGAGGAVDPRLGNGCLDAVGMLRVPVASPGQLTCQSPDSATFPFLQVLTGLGLQSPDSLQMINVELLQLAQRYPELGAIIPDPDAAEGVSPNKVDAFLSAATTIPTASRHLRAALSNHLKAGSVSVPEVPKSNSAEVVANKPAKWTPPPPPCRKLRGYVFDPSVSTQLQYVSLSETTYKIRWEAGLQPGPVGEYLSVVNDGETPVDLNTPHLLAQDGLEPSEGCAQFRQQMLYAVGMQTIEVFEHALGRLIQWAPNPDGSFNKLLKLLPHGLPAPNAFYSPSDRTIYFGYFEASNLTGTAYGMVHAALSHDIIAHEMTHALLDGIHSAFREPSNPDVLAFHEAFADVVALLQQFSNRDVVKNQSAAVHGDLSMENLLGNLARQFGNATSGRSALRSGYLSFDKDGHTVAMHPEKTLWKSNTDPHARGAVLVSAVYGAFLAIYKTRTVDLYRIASNGASDTALHLIAADLVNRLAQEASRSARHVLRMCIRALDYCPPVDINFGDYLRAIVTADVDVVPDDPLHYRVAFIESFRAWGIYPDGLDALATETLMWPPIKLPKSGILGPVVTLLREFARQQGSTTERKQLFATNKACTEMLEEKLRILLGDAQQRSNLSDLLGLDPEVDLEITRLRFSHKVSPSGALRPRVLVSICQRQGADAAGVAIRWGVTLIMDLSEKEVLCGIKKPRSKIEADRRAMQLGVAGSPTPTPLALEEPFLLLHQR